MLTKADIEQFFITEKNASLFLLIAGVLALVAAIALAVFCKTALAKGLAASLLILGLWQVFLGYSHYKKDDVRNQRRVNAVYAYDLDPQQLTEKEIPMVKQALASIKRFIGIELAIILVGLMVWFVFRQKASFITGVGLGLLLGTILMLTTELLVYSKNTQYLQKLLEYTAKSK